MVTTGSEWQELSLVSASGFLCVLCVSVVEIRLRAPRAIFSERSLGKKPRYYRFESCIFAMIFKPQNFRPQPFDRLRP